ncbi:monocarboxylate transporter 12-like [Vanessa cardui]|uniref:monocarboxylate transporter 12-like n=1 Tax=Vanessa cardui TaxID=171605 RepID=UPI001F131CF5|nr:monocarboxylate transporter 12-like [Vanessa cardui]
MGVIEKNGKKYEFVAPDGGWGYMIGVGVIINLITTSTFVACYGMIFKDLFIELNMDSTGITFLNGVSAISAAFAGMIVNPLLKLLSLRQLGLVASIIFNLGIIFGNIFVNSKLSFFLCLGVLQSVGNGLIYNISCTILNHYFVKRRLLAVSFTQTVIGAVALVSPQFVKWNLETYGFRGTLLIISAVSLQNIIGMALMQPVEWHMKKVEVPEEIETETKSLLAMEEKGFKGEEDLKKVNKSETENAIKNPTEKFSVENPKDEENQCKKNFMSNIIDVSLLKTFLISNAAVGVALSLFSEYLFTFLLPQALYALGWNEGNIAWALTLNAMTDLGTRAFFIFMSGWLLNVGSHEIYVVGLVLALITKLGMLWSDDMLVMTVFITMMGIPRCTIMMLLPVVVADSVDPDKFSSAIGIVLLLFAFFNLTVGPAIGAIRDLTNSYSTAFYILSSCFGIVIMFWTIELIYKKNKHKRIPKEDSIKA